MPFAELHCHSHFSFLDGASPPDDLVERAVELGLAGLAVTDHQGLYGAVRFCDRGPGGRPARRSSAWRSSCSTRPSPIPSGLVVPRRRRAAPRRRDRRRERRPAEGRRAGHARRSSDCGRPVIASRGARTCAASGHGSWGRTSCCWRGT